MQIEIGKYYVNKTWKYLMPCLKSYGPTFTAKFNCLFKLAVAIDDYALDDRFKGKKVIYVMFDKKYKEHITNNVLEWFRYQEFVLLDYPYDDLQTGRKHVLVIEIPELMHDAYDFFTDSKYSLMYTQADIDYLFSNVDKSTVDVLNREQAAYDEFMLKVKRNFGTELKKSDLWGAELDFPIEKYKEIFNYEVR